MPSCLLQAAEEENCRLQGELDRANAKLAEQAAQLAAAAEREQVHSAMHLCPCCLNPSLPLSLSALSQRVHFSHQGPAGSLHMCDTVLHMQGSLQPAPASPIYLMQALRRERDLHAQQMSEYRAAYARQLQLQAEREALANGAGDAGELLAAKERELEVCAGRGVGVVLPCQSGWCGVRPVAALPNSLHALG